MSCFDLTTTKRRYLFVGFFFIWPTGIYLWAFQLGKSFYWEIYFSSSLDLRSHAPLNFQYYLSRYIGSECEIEKIGGGKIVFCLECKLKGVPKLEKKQFAT
jgi:hypothetical protein